MYRTGGSRAEARERAREAVDSIVRAIVRHYDPERVILFGSYARSDIHEGSDIDLIIVKDTQERFTDRIGQILGAVDSDIAVEPLVYTPAEFRRMIDGGNDFILTALAEGEVVYEK